MDLIFYIVISLLIIVIFALVYGLRNQLNKLSIYEDWVREFSLTVEAINTELDRLDTEGVFRSDDEVGFFFQSMYSILRRLDEYGITVNMIGDEIEIPDEELKILYSRNNELKKRIDKRRDNSIRIEDAQKKVFGENIISDEESNE